MRNDAVGNRKGMRRYRSLPFILADDYEIDIPGCKADFVCNFAGDARPSRFDRHPDGFGLKHRFSSLCICAQATFEKYARRVNLAWFIDRWDVRRRRDMNTVQSRLARQAQSNSEANSRARCFASIDVDQ